MIVHKVSASTINIYIKISSFRYQVEVELRATWRWPVAFGSVCFMSVWKVNESRECSHPM